MKIKNILVSQPAPPSLVKSPFNEISQKYNVTIDFTPLIKVEGVTIQEFRSQRLDVLAHTAVIFTSRTVIDNFFRVCEQARITMPDSMKYFCTTEAVALYLQKYIIYRKRKVFFGKGSFQEMAEVIFKHNEEHFLLPLVEPHKLEVPEALDKLSIKYSKLVIARTVSADLQGIDFMKYDILVFYSPAEIEVLKSNFPDIKGDKKPFIATFGNGTAVAADAAGMAVGILAPTPTSPSMTTALDTFIKDFNLNGKVESVKIEKQDNMASIIKLAQPKTVKVAVKKPATKKAAAKKTTVRKTVKTGDLKSEAKHVVKSRLAKTEAGKSAAKGVLAKRAK